MKKAIIFLLTFILLISQAGLALGEGAPQIDWLQGPAAVDVGDNLAKLNLPDNYLFTGAKGTKAAMKYYGNPVSNQEVGMVIPKDQNADWFILFEYNPIGFVKDNESSKLDADELLKSIKKGTEEANKQREKDDVPPLNIVGWDEKPHYDSQTHNLVWSVLAESEGERVINYSTDILGRHGITSVTLVADPAEVQFIKPELQNILANFSYIPGKKYSDFTSGDKVAEFGLTALIAGGAGAAAVKAGLLAKILLVFKKFWYLLFVVLGGGFKKFAGLFKRKPDFEPGPNPYNNSSAPNPFNDSPSGGSNGSPVFPVNDPLGHYTTPGEVETAAGSGNRTSADRLEKEFKDIKF